MKSHMYFSISLCFFLSLTTRYSHWLQGNTENSVLVWMEAMNIVAIFMVTPCIDSNIILYYPTNALNYMNCRIFKDTLKI